MSCFFQIKYIYRISTGITKTKSEEASLYGNMQMID